MARLVPLTARGREGVDDDVVPSRRALPLAQSLTRRRKKTRWFPPL
ncbi:hypothetical protein SCATT_p03850 (plasmid) [Streptantibioticus cattleyicolor NRRL 8057 = DSM 46488]|uniref:Uncharacterized protein n=1 Tax=Streptantibioticus cattleyicolor (strain ATCC 35852 / DSM 46488 / JCM 4925 / NBRC 14057 / NRRL 8057) TaxID=1003195 RepID=G8XFK8_STREN|nr:hypothetical protein SCATT_p03850 [Streptantibioticus cattleyicolor NRRL 8057 = DSM 46488]